MLSGVSGSHTTSASNSPTHTIGSGVFPVAAQLPFQRTTLQNQHCMTRRAVLSDNVTCGEVVCMGVQARLGAPVLVMVQACTPPLLLAGPMGRKKLEPWRGILHSCNVVLAVMLSRFAIFDIVAVSPRRPPFIAPLFAECQPICLPHVAFHAGTFLVPRLQTTTYYFS